MKVIFLDFDGVLNTLGNAEEYRYAPEWAKAWGFIWVLKDKVEILSEFLNWDDVKLVISSTWRENWSQIYLTEILNDEVSGVGDEIISTTPVMHTKRGVEIKSWLENTDFDVTHYAIIDDNIDMLPSQMPFFVQTNDSVGLTKEDMRKVYDILHQ